MKLIVGLGNPGAKYEGTRHNVGFMFLDYCLEVLGVEDGWQEDKKNKSLVLKCGELIFVKPLTFMNLSGEAVVKVLNYYKLSLDDLVVVYDDVDIDLGRVRFREKGSAGTHNGMKSIIGCLGSSDFKRLRLGIESRGRFAPEQEALNSFVLKNFKSEELEVLVGVFKEGVKLLELAV